jgi:serine/threonine-protein phosphatase 4 catalytic subunit
MSASDLDKQIQQLKECKILTENEVKDLCNKARDLFIEESNVQDIQAPITVSCILTHFCRFAGTSMASFTT